MLQWVKTCTDCNWNAVCEHKKVLWNGVAFQYVTAVCRSMDGKTFIPSVLPSEPQDWLLWATIYNDRRLIVYGKAQFIKAVDKTDIGLGVDSPSNSRGRAAKVLHSPTDLPQRDTITRPLLGLKSVYDNGSTDQGSLF